MVCRLSLRKPYQLNILSFQPHSVNKFSIDICANFPHFYALFLIQSETFSLILPGLMVSYPLFTQDLPKKSTSEDSDVL